jgi:hypothetical protein
MIIVRQFTTADVVLPAMNTHRGDMAMTRISLVPSAV